MPIYDYSCKECKNTFEERHTMSEREVPFNIPCPNCGKMAVKQIMCSPAICDPVLIGVKKAPADFQKYVLGRIAASVPGNKIKDKIFARDI